MRLLGHAAASGRLEEPPAYVVDQILAAIPDIRLAWTRGDALAATAHLKLWTGPLGVTEGGMARG